MSSDSLFSDEDVTALRGVRDAFCQLTAAVERLPPFWPEPWVQRAAAHRRRAGLMMDAARVGRGENTQ